MNSQKHEPRKRNYMVIGPLAGGLLGAMFGIILSLAVDNFAFIGVGVALGTSVGAAIGQDLHLKEGNEVK